MPPSSFFNCSSAYKLLWLLWLHIVYTLLEPQEQVLNRNVDFPSWSYCGVRTLSTRDISSATGGFSPMVMKPSALAWFTQQFGIFSSKAAFSYCLLLQQWINANHLQSQAAGQTTFWPCPSLSKPLTCTELSCGKHRVDPHCLVMRRYWNIPTPHTWEEQHLQCWGSQTSYQPQLAPAYLYLERAGPWAGCSWISLPCCHISYQITFSLELLSYHLSRLYILHYQSKFTGLVSSTQQPTKPVFWEDNEVHAPIAKGQLSDLHFLLHSTARACSSDSQTDHCQQALCKTVVVVTP